MAEKGVWEYSGTNDKTGNKTLRAQCKMARRRRGQWNQTRNTMEES